jgi:hypothetical protein
MYNKKIVKKKPQKAKINFQNSIFLYNTGAKNNNEK